MANQFVVTTSAQVLGRQTQQTNNVPYDTGVLCEPAAGVGPAFPGTLSTRTDTNTGVVTVTGSHTITTGNKVGVFWAGGQRRNVTVGTVAGATVPIDLGAGRDLPPATTAVTIMLESQETFALVGNNMVALAVSTPNQGQVTFYDGSNAELLAVELSANGMYVWYAGNGATNPLAGVTVAYLKFSQASAVGASGMRVFAGTN